MVVIEDTYLVLDQLTHILKRPDTTVGSIDSIDEDMFIVENNKIISKNITMNHALMKIFDEVLVNASDIVVNDKTCNCIKVTIKDSVITIINNCNGIDQIPVMHIHEESKTHVPELLFGILNSGSNFNDDIDKITGGKNGLGSKLANIFSKKFNVEIFNSHEKKLYKQSFKNNLSVTKPPIIVDCDSRKESDGYFGKYGYVKFTFKPDYERFGFDELSDDMFSLFHRRVCDIAGLHTGLKVTFNGSSVVSNFRDYVNMYYSKVVEQINIKVDRWNVCIVLENCKKPVVSFVNKIYTYNGGTHVKYIIDQITDPIIAIMKEKYNITVSASVIKKQMTVFIDSTIGNPTFTSQTKDVLGTSVGKWKNKFPCVLSKEVINKVCCGSFLNKLKIFGHSNMLKENKILNKLVASKCLNEKYDKALFAGVKNKAHLCTLIICEGDSAKAMINSGLNAVGNEYYGIIPVRGKVLNVLKAEHAKTKKDKKNSKSEMISKIYNNREVQDIMKILGLQMGTKAVISKLNYGKVCIIADADNDAISITGLLMNLFNTFWPNLLEENFITALPTPIIRAVKNKEIKRFYSDKEFEEWSKTSGNGWNVTFLKGLAGSTPADAKYYFKNYKRDVVNYVCTSNTSEIINMIFANKREDDRKVWLNSINIDELDGICVEHVNDVIDICKNGLISDNVITYDTFFNKIYILFSKYVITRAIPLLMDGFKTSQRKIIYGAMNLFKGNKKSIKVSSMASSVCDFTHYHHGSVSLEKAMIGMARNYCSKVSNNINYLTPDGQFGSRNTSDGSDSGSSRYISVGKSDILNYMFRPEDVCIYDYTYDEGLKSEPSVLYPIIPNVLINGVCGIGVA